MRRFVLRDRDAFTRSNGNGRFFSRWARTSKGACLVAEAVVSPGRRKSRERLGRLVGSPADRVERFARENSCSADARRARLHRTVSPSVASPRAAFVRDDFGYG